MTTSFVPKKKWGIASLSLIAASALVLSGCGAPPGEGGDGGSTAAATQYGDFLGCIVSDSGGFNDQSFNQSSYEGLEQAKAEFGINVKEAQSKADSDYAPNMNQMMQAGCDLTLSVGFKLADATKAAATENPDAKFAIIDFGDLGVPNVKPIQYDTAQAAFLAGYLAAGQTKTGKVGTFGGIKLPTVTIFMDGFYDGVQYYNEQKGKNVEVLGWNKDTQEGAFANTFEIIQEGTKAAQNLINEGADIVLPVAGPLGSGAGDAVLAANDAGKDVSLIWVDSDGYESAPKYKSIILTSVMKQMKKSAYEVTKETAEGNFSAEPYIGTLENDGVGLAEFHDFDSKVSDEMKKELEDIKAGIIDGSIKVESAASPK
ncbi:BMP family lipoprotein [Haematomicrobium sanguinis]|uniref:BMP family lipoprotein n=1 Tax=Haematomicrobium sanguinis TaxID=479106 RepID=UPI000B0395EE|nr:BMP family ABC transporter substrate-binding protein [Haematomicrobium sanguinis]